MKIDVQKTIKSLPKKINIPKFHLQYMEPKSVTKAIEWVTHSVHTSSGEAKMKWKKIAKQFPTNFRWRVKSL